MRLCCNFVFKCGDNPVWDIHYRENDESDLRKRSSWENLHRAGRAGRRRQWSDCVESWNRGHRKDYGVSCKLKARARICSTQCCTYVDQCERTQRCGKDRERATTRRDEFSDGANEIAWSHCWQHPGYSGNHDAVRAFASGHALRSSRIRLPQRPAELRLDSRRGNRCDYGSAYPPSWGPPVCLSIQALTPERMLSLLCSRP